MTRFVTVVLFLALIFVLDLASLDPVDFVIGLVIAVGAVVMFSPHLLERGGPSPISMVKRIMAAPWMLVGITLNIIKGTIDVSAIVLGLRPLRQPGIVAVPFGDRTRLGVVISSLETTLAPGSFLVDIDWQQRVMLIHAIDASDPDKVRNDHQEFYERFQKAVFP